MTPTPPSGSGTPPIRVGIPWRMTKEQRERNHKKLDYYFESVRKAGADPYDIKLDQDPAQLLAQLSDLDGFVLPGSPADIDPVRYATAKHPKTNEIDENRDRTDFAILGHAFETGKPVLAICFGCQSLNVYRKGTLIQDIPAERPGSVAHGQTDLPSGAPPSAVPKGDLEHSVLFSEGSLLARLNGATTGQINSSHHQAIDKPGDGLRVTARAPDGTIEGVELIGNSNWVVGVQWHPERMPEDALSQKLFAEFVAAVRSARGSVVQKA
jgi:putative glutamine amidotransferase